MEIATWNVNSIRSRQEQVIAWLKANPVDILCLQEIKVIDSAFPLDPFTALGYHCQFSGQKAYNGVAILSRTPLENATCGFAPVLGSQAEDWDQQKRVITGIYQGVRIVNLYVPNGAAVGDEKYAYKLNWLAQLKQYLQELLTISAAPICLCGDFNIAPEDRDIYNPEGKGGHIMASPPERAALADILSLGWQDSFRKFTPEGGHFSWWDYRAGSFPRNQGWRIDHIYLDSALYQQAVACRIDREPRGWEKPSDHAPVVVTL